MKKRLMAVALSAALLPACFPFAASADTATTYNFAELEGYYKTQGRVTLNGSVLEMDTSSSGFEFYYSGSGDVSLLTTIRCNYTTDMFLTVIVDGERNRMRVDTGTTGTFVERELTLASGLENGVHHIEFYKQTEASSAFVNACELTLRGALLSSPPLDKMTVEVIGDSISGGASMLWTSDSTQNADYPVYQDGTLTYAYLAGENLGANVRVTQTSGYGCVNGWNSDGINLQDMYPYTSYWRSNQVLYDFDPPAQIVVINLGTNDYTARNKNNMSDEDFKNGALNLMRMARTKNPGSQIVWCTGMMGTFYKDILTQAISELGGTANGYYFCELPYGTDGGAGHPNTAQHAAAAQTLTDFLLANCLPQDYQADFASAEQLTAALDAAASITTQSAALKEAVFWAQAELSLGTSDAYRLGCRLKALEQAMNGVAVGLDLMPRQYIASCPQESGSYIWPYYNADGSVTLYKGGEGRYWPYIETLEAAQTVNLYSTPYLNIRETGNASFNVHLSYKAAGTTYTVTASSLAGRGDNDFDPGELCVTLDLGKAILEKGHADENGNVVLIGCYIYTVGEMDEYVTLSTCQISNDAAFGAPKEITGSYTVENGLIGGVAAGTTAQQLIDAMDNSDYLSVVDNGTVVTGRLATGMTLRLAAGGQTIQEVLIAVDGDVNGDGVINTQDCRAALSMSLGYDGYSAVQQRAGDVNSDGRVSTADVRRMLWEVANAL